LLERVMTPVGSRLFVLSSEEPLRDDLHFTPEAVETLVSALREQFHYVILDVPRTPAPRYHRALDLADFRIIVGDQTLRSVRDATRLRNVLGEGDAAHRTLFVVNRHGEGGRHAVTLREMHNIVDLRPRAVIPFQPTLFATAASSPPSAAGRIPRATLRAEVAKLVSEIATEQRVELNETEESALATELTDDMIGLGPLEPLLEDDDVTDILVNGPYSVYVERQGKLEK